MRMAWRRRKPADQGQETSAPDAADQAPRPKNPWRWLWATIAAVAFWLAFTYGFPQLSAVISGTRAVATVDDNRHSLRGPAEVWVHYTTADGTEQEASTASRERVVGSQVPIYYDSQHPERIRIVGDWNGTFWIVFLAGGGGFFLWAATAKPTD